LTSAPVDTQHLRVCRPGNRTGTPNYLAPELIKRTQTDLRVDLFALGVTAYEVFTANLPWENTRSVANACLTTSQYRQSPLDFKPI